MTPYLITLIAHSWLRWLVLLGGLGAVAVLVSGALAKRPFGPSDARPVRIFLIAFDTQVLVGLLLYFVLSPMGLPHGDMGAIMKTPALRYYAVEHIFGMLVAVAVAHVLWVRAKKGPEDQRRGRALWAVGLSLFIILVTHPWPGRAYGRPLLRTSSVAHSSARVLPA